MPPEVIRRRMFWHAHQPPLRPRSAGISVRKQRQRLVSFVYFNYNIITHLFLPCTVRVHGWLAATSTLRPLAIMHLARAWGDFCLASSVVGVVLVQSLDGPARRAPRSAQGRRSESPLGLRVQRCTRMVNLTSPSIPLCPRRRRRAKAVSIGTDAEADAHRVFGGGGWVENGT